MYVHEFLEERRVHLLNKRHVILDRMAGNMPEEHRHYKLKLLEAIKAALQRIDDGTYGLCITCNEIIPTARLAKLPEAARCVDCQEEHDHQRQQIAS